VCSCIPPDALPPAEVRGPGGELLRSSLRIECGLCQRAFATELRRQLEAAGKQDSADRSQLLRSLDLPRLNAAWRLLLVAPPQPTSRAQNVAPPKAPHMPPRPSGRNSSSGESKRISVSLLECSTWYACTVLKDSTWYICSAFAQNERTVLHSMYSHRDSTYDGPQTKAFVLRA
jgi:hypothetical protein